VAVREDPRYWIDLILKPSSFRGSRTLWLRDELDDPAFPITKGSSWVEAVLASGIVDKPGQRPRPGGKGATDDGVRAREHRLGGRRPETAEGNGPPFRFLMESLKISVRNERDATSPKP
jgi:hypothetical protein